ncbi:MAG: tetraacyldisaccharide 4'-kinase [Acidimicrobiia bacterium]|nr:tetraacyldisaccharide 4'-kinase [Acidimicrobiia bacterium]
MWYLLYNVLLLAGSPLILLILLGKKRSRPGLLQRLGLRLPPAGNPGADVIWVHAVSLGEVVAVTPLVQALRTRYPHDRLVVSTVTETGREAVEQRLAGVAEHCYAPLDFPWTVHAFVRRLKPRAVLFVETELWPNLLRALHRTGVPAIMINGRLSTKSFRGYRRLKPFMTQVLEAVTLCLMQSDRDAERIMALGAEPARVVRTGNIKFDQPVPDPASMTHGLSRGRLGLADREELIVAGSTHPVEEDRLLDSYVALQKEFPELVLLMAPRHIERVSQLEASVKARGLAVQRRSERSDSPSVASTTGTPRVIILDTRGELAYVYHHAVLAFVGGTLVPVGGHNLLEPAVWGRPVFFGPHTDHCAESASLLSAVGGGRQVPDGPALTKAMAACLRDRVVLQAMGAAATSVVVDNRGAVQRSVDLIAHVLDRPAVAPLAARMPAALWWPVTVLAALYGLMMRLRAAMYRAGLVPSRRLPCRVISIGNLTVGGTGKTPVVIAVVERLLADGRRVGVLSRGYHRQSTQTMLLVSNGQTVLAGPAAAGDEPYLIARRCPRAVVAVGADRYRVGRWVLAQFPLDCLVLDDGFQHQALQRDVNILLVDASDPNGLRALLPAGRLREPRAAAARATAILLTRTESGDSQRVLAALEDVVGMLPSPAHSRFVVDTVIDVVTGDVCPATVLAGRAALAVSGVGNPASFRSLLKGLGVVIRSERVFSDHHDYTAADLEAIRAEGKRSGVDLIVTTEKDAGKLAPLLMWSDEVRAVRLGLEIVDGRELFDRLILGNDAGGTRNEEVGMRHG